MTIRHVLTLNKAASRHDLEALHRLVMSGFMHSRAEANILFSPAGQLSAIDGKQSPGGIMKMRPRKVLVQADQPGDWSLNSHVDETKDLGETDYTLSDEIAVKGYIELAGDRGGKTHITKAQAPDFITGKLERAGLDVERLHLGHVLRSTRKGKPISLVMVNAAGQVRDEERLTEALRTGIGRGKAFGGGLLRHALA